MPFKFKNNFIIYEDGDSSSGLLVFVPFKKFLAILRVEYKFLKNNKAFIFANLKFRKYFLLHLA